MESGCDGTYLEVLHEIVKHPQTLCVRRVVDLCQTADLCGLYPSARTPYVISPGALRRTRASGDLYTAGLKG